MNLCRACGQDFASLSAFDDHRVGKHAYLQSEAHLDGRRCLPPEELHSLGMRRDSRGRWRLPIRGTRPWTSDATDQNRTKPIPRSSGPGGGSTRQKRHITRSASRGAAKPKASRDKTRSEHKKPEGDIRHPEKAQRA